MYKVFNMGHRMELYVPKEAAQHIINVAAKYNIDAQVIGRVESHPAKSLLLEAHTGCLNTRAIPSIFRNFARIIEELC